MWCPHTMRTTPGPLAAPAERKRREASAAPQVVWVKPSLPQDTPPATPQLHLRSTTPASSGHLKRRRSSRGDPGPGRLPGKLDSDTKDAQERAVAESPAAFPPGSEPKSALGMKPPTQAGAVLSPLTHQLQGAWHSGPSSCPGGWQNRASPRAQDRAGLQPDPHPPPPPGCTVSHGLIPSGACVLPTKRKQLVMPPCLSRHRALGLSQGLQSHGRRDPGTPEPQSRVAIPPPTSQPGRAAEALLKPSMPRGGPSAPSWHLPVPGPRSSSSRPSSPALPRLGGMVLLRRTSPRSERLPGRAASCGPATL